MDAFRRLARPVVARRFSALLVAPMTVLAFAAPASIQSSVPTGAAPAHADTHPAVALPSSDAAAPTDTALAARTAPVSFASATATPDVPAMALVAYHRAEAVINASSKTCQLPWQVLAAIGQLESDHGRRTPPAATPLDDTDAGLYDGTAQHDLPMGPLQITPQVWSKVAIDADGDGTRDANDLDDATLGLAVLLCSTSESLGTPDGQRLAVARHNANRDYINAVIALAGDYARPSVVSARMTPPTLVGPAVPKPAKTLARKPARTKAEIGTAGGAAIPPPPAEPTKTPEPTEEIPGGPAEEPTGQPTAGDHTHTPGPPEESPATPPEPEPTPGDQPGEETCLTDEQVPANEQLPADEQPEDPEADPDDDGSPCALVEGTEETEDTEARQES